MNMTCQLETNRSLISEVLEVEVAEYRIDRIELYVTDEAFFYGTGVQICAIAH